MKIWQKSLNFEAKNFKDFIINHHKYQPYAINRFYHSSDIKKCAKAKKCVSNLKKVSSSDEQVAKYSQDDKNYADMAREEE